MSVSSVYDNKYDMIMHVAKVIHTAGYIRRTYVRLVSKSGGSETSTHTYVQKRSISARQIRLNRVNCSHVIENIHVGRFLSRDLTRLPWTIIVAGRFESVTRMRAHSRARNAIWRVARLMENI